MKEFDKFVQEAQKTKMEELWGKVITRCGSMHKSGDVVITRVQFADNEGSKIRPALVLFGELGNIVIAGITTNLQTKGIRISKKEGAAHDSVIKLNYIFTITDDAIIKTVFQLNPEKKHLVFEEFIKKFSSLKG